MKTSEALKLIDAGYVRKYGGFRVHFQMIENDEIQTDFVPNKAEKHLDSDVVAWRLAWKLAQSSTADERQRFRGDFINIFVVDEDVRPIKHYATNRYEVFNSTRTDNG